MPCLSIRAIRGWPSFAFTFARASFTLQRVTTDVFGQEIAEATKAYDKYVVCLNKTPEEFEAALKSLLNKAIKAYESRGPDLRHGIALDPQVTIILSQSDTARPLCGIYFNLHREAAKRAHRWGPVEVRKLTHCAADAHCPRVSSPTCASPATKSATMLSSRCGPVTLTSPTFWPCR